MSNRNFDMSQIDLGGGADIDGFLSSASNEDGGVYTTIFILLGPRRVLATPGGGMRGVMMPVQDRARQRSHVAVGLNLGLKKGHLASFQPPPAEEADEGERERAVGAYDAVKRFAV